MLTINLTYYNEPKYLKMWYDFNEELINKGFDVLLTICDDASQIYPARDFFEEYPPNENTSLYTVTKNLGFNSHGCRNLLMRETKTEWNLLIDIDTMIDPSMLLREFEKGHVYMTSANPNIFFVHKDDFWESGGYDEILVGVHEGDKPLIKYFERNTHVHIIDGLKIHRNGRRGTHGHDSETIEYCDETMTIKVPRYYWPNDRWMFHNINDFVYRRYKDPVERKKKPVIQFDYIKNF